MNSSFRVSKRLLLLDKKYKVIFEKGSITKFDSNSKNEIKLQCNLMQFISSIRLFQRLLRLEPRLLTKLDETRCILAYNGNLLIIDLKKWKIVNTISLRDGMHSPLNYDRTNGISNLPEGIIFGDYFSNDDRSTVNVYCFNKAEEELIVLYSFEAGKVRHIHSCVTDVENNRVLVLTGDEDAESGIWALNTDNKTLKPILCGSQQYRACVAFVENDTIIYATDTPLSNNYIYAYNEKKKELNKIIDIPGSCIYGIDFSFLEEKFYMFATAVEPDSRLGKIRYLTTRKRSRYIKDNYVHIYLGNLKRGFKDVFSFEKDIMPMGLFQFGNVEFKLSEDKKNLIIQPTAVKKVDGCSLVISIKDLIGKIK